MASLATVNIPTCKWAQRKECVFVTVDIADAKDEEIVIADDKLTFKAMSNGKPYECEMTLHAAISMEGSKYTVKGRNVQFYLEKTDQEADFWPRLLKDKALNKRFVKVDFDKWVDEDEEDEADAIDANGMQGMGGMPGGMGGGGMGGMPGMGGQPRSNQGGTRSQPMNGRFPKGSLVKMLRPTKFPDSPTAKHCWLVYFFSPSKDAERFKEKYEKLAKNVQGIVKLGAVDCSEHATLCEKWTASAGPEFATFYKGEHRAFPRDKFKKGSLKKLKAFAISALPGKVENVNRVSQLFATVAKAKRTASFQRVLLFCSSDYDTPLWFTSIAARYDGRVVVAEARAKNKQIGAQVGVKDFPALVLIDVSADLDSPTHTGIEIYEGSVDSSNDEQKVIAWLDGVTAAAAAAAASKTTNSQEKQKKKKQKKSRTIHDRVYGRGEL